MLSEHSPTTEHYDISVEDKEEEARQDQIDIIERQKQKSSTFMDKFNQGYQLVPDRSPTSDVGEQATNIREIASSSMFAP
eukprot:10916376-Heterocapsa_arctica.AAC.1